LATLAVDRTDIDDPAPLAVLHARKYCLGHVETSAEIDADHLVPLFIAHPHQRAITRDAGIVDEDIDGTKVGYDLIAPT
jgi:hypothetical protein